MNITDDLADEQVLIDPNNYYKTLRENEPLYWNEKWGGWIVTRYDDVKTFLRNNDNLSVEHSIGEQDGQQRTQMAKYLSNWLSFNDPPSHHRLRMLAVEAFNAANIKERKPEIEDLTQSLIEDIEQRGENQIDFVDDFAYKLPLSVVSKMIGVPGDRREDVKEWSEDIAAAFQLRYGMEDRRRNTERSVKEMAEFLHELVEQREANPRDDYITHLTQAEKESKELERDEIVALSMNLLIAGHDTTTKLMTNGVCELLKHPEQKEMLQQDPSLAKSATEEILRYQTPTKGLVRSVKSDFEFQGHEFKEGQRVLLGLAAANRDPRKFDEPDRFDIARGSDEHLSFGDGIHTCIGAPLARLETRVALPAFLDAFPDLELAHDDYQWEGSVITPGFETLELRI